MKTVQLRDAKATLSALVDAAEAGEPSVITRHGHPAAMLLPIDMAERLMAPGRSGFADLLLGIPADPGVERDRTALRPIDL